MIERERGTHTKGGHVKTYKRIKYGSELGSECKIGTSLTGRFMDHASDVPIEEGENAE